MLGEEPVEQRGDLGDHCRIDLARDQVSAVALGERDHADRKRHPGLDPGHRRTAPRRRRPLEADQFRGAAADVEQEHAIGLRVDQRGAAGGRQPRLGLAIDDLQLEPDLLGDAGAEFGAVHRRAARLGRDQLRPRHAAIAHLVAANGERFDCAGDRGLADAAGRRYALPQPDDAGECVDDTKAVAGGARDQQPAIVGAEIERGIGRTRMPGLALPAVVTRVAVTVTADPTGPAAARGRSWSGSRPPVARPSSFIQFLPAAPKPSGSTAAAMSRRYRRKCNTGEARATDARWSRCTVQSCARDHCLSHSAKDAWGIIRGFCASRFASRSKPSATSSSSTCA